MSKVAVKFNLQTSQAIVIMTDDEGNKFELTNQGKWRKLKEGQPQEIIEIVLIYDQTPDDRS